MMQQHSKSGVLVVGVGALALGVLALPAFADDVPESLRIEQKALKEYSQKPVVPIERGNAHRRDAGSPGASTATPKTLETTPNPTLPDATVPPASSPHPSDGNAQ